MLEHLDQERQQIDAIDEQIVALLEKRWDLIVQVANKKKSENLPIFDADREKLVLEKVGSFVKNEEYAPSIQKLYKEMFSLSRKYQVQKQSKE